MEFNIVDYLKGLTAFQFEDNVYTRVATERGALGITDYSTLSTKDKDLMKADLLLVAYTAPTTTASISQTHSGFSQSYGSQVISDREILYNTIFSIYNKYNDPKLAEMTQSGGYIKEIDETEYEYY